MLGQRLAPHSHHAVGRLMAPNQLGDALARLAANIGAAVTKLPSHQTFLDSYCAEGIDSATA